MVSPSNFPFKKANTIEFLFLNPSNLKNRILQPTKCVNCINQAIWKPDSTLVFTCTKHFNGKCAAFKIFFHIIDFLHKLRETLIVISDKKEVEITT